MKKLIILSIFLMFSACAGQNSGSGGSSVSVSIGGTSKTPVAEINGKPITEAELTEKVDSRLTKLKNQVFNIQRQGIGSIINERLLKEAADKEGISVQALLKKNVHDKVSDPTDKEIEAAYQRGKDRQFRGRTLEQAKAAIKQQLRSRQASLFQNNFIDRLKDKADIKIFLTRPTVDVSVDDDPMIGNKNAAVTIIEFTDYQCPYCSRARGTVKQIVDTYGDKVRYVLRDFPLNFHRQAQDAAEAAHCAGDQGKYWEYSDILWQNQRKLNVPELKKYASQLSLDQTKFDQCLDSDKYAAEVKKDLADGAKAGVTGTPSFFINGQMLTGARPFGQFKEIIDMELLSGKNKS